MPKWEYNAFLLPGGPLTTEMIVEAFDSLDDVLDNDEVVAIIPQRLEREEGEGDEPERYIVVNTIVVVRHPSGS